MVGDISRSAVGMKKTNKTPKCSIMLKVFGFARKFAN